MARREESQARSRYAFRYWQRILRRPAQDYNLWPLGVILVGSIACGVLPFLVAQAATGSFGIAFIPFLVIEGTSGALMAWLLFVPNDVQLAMLIQNAELRLRTAKETAEALGVELSNVDRVIRVDQQSLDAILKSVQYQREELLKENWRAMRDTDWEQFLARAFRLLGATVETTRVTGDQGVDLVVEIGPLRYAIQAKGYYSSVGNGAVQEAVAGMAHYRCNACAVITNSRFTGSAEILAASNRCKLIGEEHIADLVLGKLVI
ncbi:restriction endonuclease [Lacipirellula sp.]|uniref:restriction endonuclease n=1 Tax=Lacipirellula sp. TaxID=2691419 RepID=UPI003D14A111